MRQQCSLMKFDPVTGEEKPYPSSADQYRNHHGKVAWLFNPWTGEKRNPLDVGSDVVGLLILPPDEPLIAAPLSNQPEQLSEQALNRAWLDFCDKKQSKEAFKEVVRSLLSSRKDKDAEFQELLDEIAGFQEINEYNYSPEDVAELNNWGVMVWQRAEALREKKPAIDSAIAAQQGKDGE